MSLRIPSTVRIWALACGLTPTLLVRCNGTEADNPFADAVVTACKAQQDYDPGQLDDFFNQMNGTETAQAELSSVPKNDESPAELPRALTRVQDIPIGLSCIEWQLTGNRLEVQVVNVRSGCGVEFVAQTTLEGDRVTLLLENTVCAIAACDSNCRVDTATAIELPSISDINFALNLDEQCNGELEGAEWSLPLTEQPRGMICEYAFVFDAGGDRGRPFTDCPAPVVCDAGFSCVEVTTGDYSSQKCLPSCTSDEDCPLAGGTHCDGDRCVPTVARDFF